MKIIIKNISWTFIANLISAITKWLILVLIARWLDPNDLGSYSLAFAITAPITLFINLKLRPLVVTDKNLTFSNYVFTRKITSALAIILIIIIGLVLYPSYFWVITLVGLMKILDLHSDLYYSIPQINNDFDYIGKLIIFKHVITLISFFLNTLLN